MKKGKVAILGLGGLGSNIASSLARIGVGKLILADFDVVEPSNLNRQNYFINDIGKLKTEATKENIERINPFVDITLVNEKISKENMESFSEADIIVEAFDNPNCKAEISNYVLIHMRDKYLVASSGMAGYYDSNIIQTKKIRDKFYKMCIRDSDCTGKPYQFMKAAGEGQVAGLSAVSYLSKLDK